jgi:2-polyprenyl-6-methoxyphenol hydroxylase-like FAD-dependent oxidoreductase
MSESYDAIVIGTGQAGPALAVRLAKTGRKTAIIERKRFGGTCVNNGCIPTKALIASARAAHVARTASSWGVVVPPGVAVDMRAVKARKDAIVRKSTEGLATGSRIRPASPSSGRTPASMRLIRSGPATQCSKRHRFSSTSVAARACRRSPESTRSTVSR